VRTALQRLVGIRRPDIRKLYEDIRKAGELGTEAALQKIDAACRDCGHVYTHHNRLGEDGFIFRRPCGEEDCQCDDFAFTISMAEKEYEELMTVSEKSDHLPTCTCGHIVHKHSLRTADNKTKCFTEGCNCTSFDLQGAPMIVVNGKSYTREQLIEELRSKEKDWPQNGQSFFQPVVPKASEIYRQTRNQLASMKVGTDIPHIHSYGPGETRQVQFCTYDNCGFPRVRDIEDPNADKAEEEPLGILPKDIYDETFRAAGVVSVEQAQEWLNMFPSEDEEPEGDAVNHPSHYNQNGPEVIELVRWLSFNRGNAVKYIARAGKKDPAKEEEDIEKAIWYLQDELKIIRGEVK